jgi:hypothetical protein
LFAYSTTKSRLSTHQFLCYYYFNVGIKKNKSTRKAGNLISNFSYFDLYLQFYGKTISKQLKVFFETKHLYQGFEIILPRFDEAYKNIIEKDKSIAENQKMFLENMVDPLLNRISWSINNEINFLIPQDPMIIIPNTPIPLENLKIYIKAPETLKLYCSKCENREAFNCTEIMDISGDEGIITFMNFHEEQLFLFVYQCQSCKGNPEIFLLSRNKLKIHLHGRSPMESYQINSNIPKAQQLFYKDAQIAFDSGQVLPAIFLLRTLIEQFIRIEIKNKTSKDFDKLIDEYYSTLPIEFTSIYPSLREIYDRLSIDIHGAVASVEDYEKSFDEINRFFNGKKSFLREYEIIVKKKEKNL